MNTLVNPKPIHRLAARHTFYRAVKSYLGSEPPADSQWMPDEVERELALGLAQGRCLVVRRDPNAPGNFLISWLK